MFPRGIIYQEGKSGSHGEINLHPTLVVRALYNLARGVGAGLIGFVVISFLFTYWPIAKQEISYDLGIKKAPYSEGDLAIADTTSEVQAEAKSYGVSSYFSLVVPKIDASANVVPNVDAADPNEYLDALQKGVAHAKGTYFPGQGHTIFLFSHSTDSPINIARYNAVFYLLRKLTPGDRITVFFADKKYEYEVTEKRLVDPKDTSWLGDDSAGERLILQTCDPPGTSWNRLLVIAKPI